MPCVIQAPPNDHPRLRNRGWAAFVARFPFCSCGPVSIALVAKWETENCAPIQGTLEARNEAPSAPHPARGVHPWACRRQDPRARHPLPCGERETAAPHARIQPMRSPSAAAPAALICVDPARVPDVWPHVAPLIARALRRGGFAPCAEDACADLARRLRAGTALLWLAWDGETILAAAVTELAHEENIKDRAKVCTIVACAGEDFARFGHLIAGLEAYARAEGCARMRICGRPGWRRRLPGYALARVVIEKRL